MPQRDWYPVPTHPSPHDGPTQLRWTARGHYTSKVLGLLLQMIVHLSRAIMTTGRPAQPIHIVSTSIKLQSDLNGLCHPYLALCTVR
jgi:hypothetical protein